MSLTRQRRRRTATLSDSQPPVQVQPYRAAQDPGARPAPRVQSPVPVVVKRKGLGQGNHVRSNLPKWQQTGRWFWLTHPETTERELVQSSGKCHTQGPHEMVEYTTQGGRITACSIAFFEANTQPWVPGKDWR